MEKKASPHSKNQPQTLPLSVLVLTKNEEINIESCLHNLSFCDDVIVLDSYSTDQTVKIAEQFPYVRIVQRKFDTFSRHRNWAIQNIDFRHPWVYCSDADERVPPELREEIRKLISDPEQSHVAFQVRYKNMFRNRWLRHGGVYPVWLTRLFRPNKVQYEDREVNAHPIVNGSAERLEEHFLHYSFSKGLKAWFNKHNQYSTMEAHEAVRVRQGSLKHALRQTWKTDPTNRRRAIKNLSFFFPARAMWRFLYMYLAKRGFLDGFAGLHYALMVSMYEYWIELKIREHERDWTRLTDQVAEKLLGRPGG